MPIFLGLLFSSQPQLAINWDMTGLTAGVIIVCELHIWSFLSWRKGVVPGIKVLKEQTAKSSIRRSWYLPEVVITTHNCR